MTFIQHSPDVHNNTPILDIISLGDEARSISSLALLESSNTALILDTENCPRQSAVWRSVYQGHRRLTKSLLARTTDQSGARVEPVSRRTSSSYLQSSIRSLVPALLAPLLSPRITNLHFPNSPDLDLPQTELVELFQRLPACSSLQKLHFGAKVNIADKNPPPLLQDQLKDERKGQTYHCHLCFLLLPLTDSHHHHHHDRITTR